MAQTAADVLVEGIIDWGVDTVFGLPGDGINGIMEGLRRHADRIGFVLVHHEEAAAFMACAYAKGDRAARDAPHWLRQARRPSDHTSGRRGMPPHRASNHIVELSAGS